MMLRLNLILEDKHNILVFPSPVSFSSIVSLERDQSVNIHQRFIPTCSKHCVMNEKM